MTREDAIKTLKENYCAMCAYGSQNMDSCDIRSCDNKDAIKALEQETCIQEKQANADKIDAVYIDGFKAGYSQARFDLEQEPCEDCISRQEVLYLIADYDLSMGQVVKGIHALPSVAPQQKIGHWIEQIDHEENCRTLICSNCDRHALHDGDSIWKHKFCPHCGAKMESEDKE